MGYKPGGKQSGEVRVPPKSCRRRRNRQCGPSGRVRGARSLGCAPRAGGRRSLGACICVSGGVPSPEMRLNRGGGGRRQPFLCIVSLNAGREGDKKRNLCETSGKVYLENKRTEVPGRLPSGDPSPFSLSLSVPLAPIWKLLHLTSHLWAKAGTCLLLSVGFFLAGLHWSKWTRGGAVAQC